MLLLKLYLFYNDYETSYTTYINHARWHRCLRSDGLHVPVWLGDHMTISPLWPGFDTRRRHVRGECVNTAPARQLVKWQSISAIQVTIKYSFFCHNSCLLVHKWRLGGSCKHTFYTTCLNFSFYVNKTFLYDVGEAVYIS